jgi:putative membrane protein insertion efficiency factor
MWLISRYRAHRLVENACRFVPSCSEYALIAVDRFGVWGGLVLTLKRLLRCRLPHGGYDPVPHQEGDSYAGV